VTDSNTPKQHLSPDLADAGLRIDRQLTRHNMRFSPEAGETLAITQANFLADLGIEAVRLTRKDRLSTVDRVHVEKAADRLGAATGSDGIGSACNTIGGLLTGAGIAGAYNLAFGSDQITTTETMTTLASMFHAELGVA